MFLFLQRLHEANDRGDSLLHSRITDGRVFLILLLEIIAPERHPEAFVRSLHIAAIDVSIDLLERELPAVSPAKLGDRATRNNDIVVRLSPRDSASG